MSRGESNWNESVLVAFVCRQAPHWPLKVSAMVRVGWLSNAPTPASSPAWGIILWRSKGANGSGRGSSLWELRNCRLFAATWFASHTGNYHCGDKRANERRCILAHSFVLHQSRAGQVSELASRKGLTNGWWYLSWRCSFSWAPKWWACLQSMSTAAHNNNRPTLVALVGGR